MESLRSGHETISNKGTLEVDERKIDAIFSELNQCQLPGAAVGIAIHGKPVYRKGFGLASIELPLALSPMTRMRIGSTSKHFAALAYLLLCEEGKAGLEDPLVKYLPELHPVTHRATMRQLMTNTSGLRDAMQISLDFQGTGRPVSVGDMLALYRKIDDTNAAPGTTWIYINGGWVLLGAVIERITGCPLEEVLYKRIFEPVGMYDTLLRRYDTDFVSNSATLHMVTPDGAFIKSYEGIAKTAEGGIASTVDDLLRWLAHMSAPWVGSPETWSTMKAPQRLTNGTGTGYGFGLISGHYRGIETLHHGGSVMGGSAQMLKVPSLGLDLALISNRFDFDVGLADRVLDACLPGLEPARTRPGGASAVVGVFRSPTSGRVIQLCTSSSALYARHATQIASIDGLDVPVEADEAGVLLPSGVFDYARQSITRIGDPKRPRAITFNDFGTIDELIAVSPVAKPRTNIIAGLYRWQATGIQAEVRETQEGPQLKTSGPFGSTEYTLECLAEGIWRARGKLVFPPGGVLSFDEDGSGFLFSNFRSRSIPFRRLAG